ncbi:MAG TPA: type I glyceraldehyde-3-phosphate dehydrogenase [Puia sp.]|jgi:glyceraldehyde 3-phosphate dehydrogenase|nr:type I glyceraldehyde-3-phosphate dehydrogenase [Puia sp.]
MRIAINGFGRIGRMTLRAFQDKADVEIVAVNDLTDTKTLAHLLKYDTVHGKFPGEISTDGDVIQVNGKGILMLSVKDPANLPWKDFNIDLVVESTGKFVTKEKAEAHLIAGAKKVLITAPAAGGVKTIVRGINDETIGDDQIYSTASCTTGSIAPILYILHREFGIENGFMVTVHAFTSDQNLQDGPHRDIRRARAATCSIIPTTTGAAKAISDVLPALKGKMDGFSYRVPVIDGSISDLSVNLSKPVSAKQLNDVLKQYAGTSLKGILEYTEEQWVSSDIIGNTHSSIVDGTLTRSIGNMVKVVSWYDNEMGISTRISELARML